MTRRRSAPMQLLYHERLVQNIAGAASVVGELGDPLAVIVCSHSYTSRLDVRLGGNMRFALSRGAHCSTDAPAMIAGELLISAIETAIDIDR